jgi:hypothetical protein
MKMGTYYGRIAERAVNRGETRDAFVRQHPPKSRAAAGEAYDAAAAKATVVNAAVARRVA